MKKIIFVFFAALIMGQVANAQKISSDMVPVAVKSALKAKFPTATGATWEKENKTEFEANFKLNGEEVSANFDNTGKWLETETEIKVSALPIAIQSALKTNFAGFKINEASKIESLKNGSCYEAEIEKGEETFDVLLKKDGSVISKTKIEGEKKD